MSAVCKSCNCRDAPCVSISRILSSKLNTDLQIVFYYLMPTEIIRFITEFLYQPHLIEIQYKTKERNPEYDKILPEIDLYYHDFIPEYIFEDLTIYNCSACFVYNFICFTVSNCVRTPRLRKDINWFNKKINRNQLFQCFDKYYNDLHKFKLPLKYKMIFYRSQQVIKEFRNEVNVSISEEVFNSGEMFNNDNIQTIIITEI